MPPLVSWLLSTRNRASFVRHTIGCFTRQSYPNVELIIVDASDEATPDLGDTPGVHYIHVPADTEIGTCLNIGAEASRGEILQKIDDDDYYTPAYVENAVTALNGRDDTIVTWDCFFVLLHDDERLRFSGHGWSADGTLTFDRRLWERAHFQDVHWPEEPFRADTQARIVQLCAPKAYVLVRHRGNNWQSLKGVDVNAYFRELSPALNAEHLMERSAIEFYRNL